MQTILTRLLLALAVACLLQPVTGCTGNGAVDPNGNGDGERVNLPPVASFTARILAGLRVEFNAYSSRDPDGEILRYDWNFHWIAGSTETWELRDTGPHVSFTYAEPGTYFVQLQVTDDDGVSATETVQLKLGDGNGGGDVDPVVPGEPYAQLTSYPGTEPLAIQLDASASFDMDGSIVRFDWDFNNDGTFDLEDGPEALVHTYDEAGIYTVRVRVTDNEGKTDDATLQVTITGEINDPTNQSPEAAVGATPTEGTAPLEVLIFDQGSQDPDGWIAAYEWDIDGDGEFEDTTSGGTVEHTFTAPGTYVVTLRVTDNQGKADTAEVTITVNEEGGGGSNEAPVAKAGATPTSGTAPLDVTIYDQGSSDDDGWIASYDWDMDDDGTFELVGDAGPHERTFDAAGTYDVHLRVTDDDGAMDTATVTIEVTESGGGGSNEKPVARAGATPLTGAAPLEVTIYDQGSEDPDGWIASYDWDFDNDGTFELISDPGPHERTLDVAGQYIVALRVTDNDGAEDIDTVTIVVTGSGGGGNNESPIARAGATPLTGDAPLEVTIYDQGSEDPDGWIDSYDWDFDNNGTFEVIGDAGPHERTYETAGTYVVNLRVVDNNGAEDTASVTITVGSGGSGSDNLAPTAIITASPILGDAPLDVVISDLGSLDPDGAIVAYDWDLDDDGVFEILGHPGPHNRTFADPGVYLVSLRVTDDDGAQHTGSVAIVVLAP